MPVDFEEVTIPSTSYEEDVHDAILAVRRNRVAFKGNTETDHSLPPCHKSCNVFRTALGLYANATHIKSLPGMETRYKYVDIFVVRENTEGEYSNL